MKNLLLLLITLFVFTIHSYSQGIEGITLENYPRMDGSTSTEPLNRIIAKNLLDINFDSIVPDENYKYYYWNIIELTIHVNDGEGNISEIFYPRTKNPDFPYYTSWYHTPLYLNLEDIDLCNGCFIESIDSISICESYTTQKYNHENFIGTRVKSSQTHNAIINVIDDLTDISLSARKLSEDEKAYAESKGITLIETPIASDAFVFLKNKENPVTSLTIEQIQGIYTGQISNWNEVGGNNAEIIPYVRNANSGSQELMNQLVLPGFPTQTYPEDITLTIMGNVYSKLSYNIDAICYTVYYYDENVLWVPGGKEYRFIAIKDSKSGNLEMFEGRYNEDGEIIPDDEYRYHYEYNTVQKLSVNGIYPQYSTIKDKTYPFIAPVYAIIRSDLDRNSMAYKVYEWLQTEEGKSAIEESGYIAYTMGGTQIPKIEKSDDALIYVTNRTINIKNTSAIVQIFDIMGRMVAQGSGSDEYEIRQPGIYIVKSNDTVKKVIVK